MLNFPFSNCDGSQGLGFLSLSATLFTSSACQNAGNKVICYPPQLQIIFFFSLYFVAVAQGGHKPCVLAFGADQFDEEDEKERKDKSSFFNRWYFSMCTSVSVGILGLNYIQDNLSWGLAFGISCIVMSIALVLFLLGNRTYRFRMQIDEMNPIMRMGRVFIEATRNWQAFPTDKSIEVEHEGNLTHEGAQFKFLDKVLFTPDDSREGGKVCSSGDVEEAKAILSLVPIWFTCLAYGIVFSQTSNQGVTMDRYITSRFKIPAASLLSFISLTIVVFVPIYDRILVPVARAITNKPSGISMLQRVGCGIFLSFLSMVVAALVEQKRLATAAEYGLVDMPKAVVPMSVWWLSPQYVLFGIADVFDMVGLQEFFYDQVSDELKSIGLDLCLSIIGIGLSAFEFVAFVYFAKSYMYRRRRRTTI
ncbi:hypothetical protein DH2020_025872 [Rehmannia glutinosa]|uniref:Protein NRT1/ PTR FAMILY 5.10-like n=1 Tax=Rehmannia glutinosa TaxID=99300 RepID=A0ABR0W0Z8_REHGL